MKFSVSAMNLHSGSRITTAKMTTLGLNIHISVHSNQGGRKYMEDVVCGKIEEDVDGELIQEPYAFFAVYDGHGGAEAAKFAEKHLHDEVIKNKAFWSDDDEQVTKAIKEGFISTHKLMWKALPTWPKTVSGLPSTAGTTASVVFIKNMKIYVAHVGDSSVVIGAKEKTLNTSQIHAHLVTVDHKPESPKERMRIEANGGKVMAKSGVQRVVWHRPRPSHKGPVRRSTPIDDIPFLAVARALGDLWSYNSEQDTFVVSPDPDVAIYDLDLHKHRCVVLASDGLWNMVRPYEAVHMVESKPKHPAMSLVNLALCRWRNRNMRADNTSVIVLNLRAQKQVMSFERRCSNTSDGSTARLSEPDTDVISDLDLDIGADIEIEPEKVDFLAESVSLTPLSKPIGLGAHHNALWGKQKDRSVYKHNPIYKGSLTAPGSAPAKLKSTESRLHQLHYSNPFSKSASLPSSLQRNLQEHSTRNSLAVSSEDVPKGTPKVPSARCSSPPTSSKSLAGKKRDSTAFSSSTNSGISEGEPSAKKQKVAHSSPLVNGEADQYQIAAVPAGPPKTPTRHVAFNLTNKPTSSLHMPKHSGKPLDSETSRTPLRNDPSPKGATSAKSPLKVDIAPREDSPSVGVISPLWPSDLACELQLSSCSDDVVLGVKAAISVMPLETTSTESSSILEGSKVVLQENGPAAVAKPCTHRYSSKSTNCARGNQNQSPRRHLAVKHKIKRARNCVRRLRAATQGYRNKKVRNINSHRTRFQVRVHHQRRS